MRELDVRDHVVPAVGVFEDLDVVDEEGGLCRDASAALGDLGAGVPLSRLALIAN